MGETGGSAAVLRVLPAGGANCDLRLSGDAGPPQKGGAQPVIIVSGLANEGRELDVFSFCVDFGMYGLLGNFLDL